jgi:hypothetical protein
VHPWVNIFPRLSQIPGVLTGELDLKCDCFFGFPVQISILYQISYVIIKSSYLTLLDHRSTYRTLESAL